MLSTLKKLISGGTTLDTPISEARFVVVDTELTGLDSAKDSIVSIGAVRLTGGRIPLGDTFHALVRPRSALTRESVVIHGITPSDVEHMPDAKGALEEFIRYMGDDVMVGHCVSIDSEFINREMGHAPGRAIGGGLIDTWALHEWLRRSKRYRGAWLSEEARNLYGLAKALGVAVNGAHDALMDAFITAQVFQRLIPVLMVEGITTLNGLFKVGDPRKGGVEFRSSGEFSNF